MNNIPWVSDSANAQTYVKQDWRREQLSQVKVAVLMATFNGAKYIEPQIKSLADNDTNFTLHWLDDDSTDNTRSIVRAAAKTSNIMLREWHQPRHQGLPGAFFQLLESVDDADIYMFCDQDDIWQPGKIDATVSNLLPDVATLQPALCFSDLLMFRDREPHNLYPLSQVLGTRPEAVIQEAKLFMSGLIAGNTEGFTRSLREIFMEHHDIARGYALMHDTWIYIIAVAAGSARFLPGAPTTLYRQHGDNVSGASGCWRGRGAGYISITWSQIQSIRRAVAKQAKGFILASPTLPSGPKLEHLLSIARLVASLDRHHSLASLFKIFRSGAMSPNRRLALGLAAACLYSGA